MLLGLGKIILRAKKVSLSVKVDQVLTKKQEILEEHLKTLPLVKNVNLSKILCQDQATTARKEQLRPRSQSAQLKVSANVPAVRAWLLINMVDQVRMILATKT